ncbi:single-stranded DNA-binding protein, partial [Pediococcus pentosaceus]|nr:single-stranded DNA-binding protein [Pediococcus pentosaceus]MBF7122801.1 single-stranded DNA-binding protein [Pediococcus pentosaceus]
QHKFKESNKETGSTDPFTNGSQPIDISDDDLPF